MRQDIAELVRQLDELKAENKRLQDFNDMLRQQRSELMAIVCKDLDKLAPTEEEVAEGMKTAVPLAQVFAELGIGHTSSSVK